MRDWRERKKGAGGRWRWRGKMRITRVAEEMNKESHTAGSRGGEGHEFTRSAPLSSCDTTLNHYIGRIAHNVTICHATVVSAVEARHVNTLYWAALLWTNGFRLAIQVSWSTRKINNTAQW
jgi:hypothetical protein